MREIRINVVRHCEYDSSAYGSGTSAPLTRAGLVRAGEVADALFREYFAGVKPVVLVSRYLRSQQTADPIARAFGVDVKVVDWAYNGPDSIGELAAVVNRPDTSLIILVGHATTIEQMYHLAGSRGYNNGSRPGEVHRFDMAIDGRAASLSSKGVVLQP